MRVEAPPLHTVVSRTCSWAERSLAFRQGAPDAEGLSTGRPGGGPAEKLALKANTGRRRSRGI